MTLRVLSIFGTRPEAVKMAPILQELGAKSGVQSTICVTAQHRHMLDRVLQLFEIKPQYDLDLMQPDQSLAALTGAIFSNLDPVLRQLQPDWVLVQGDTTTVMAASTLAFYHHVRIGHVEAGLRTGDKYNPFPEEINRRLTRRPSLCTHRMVAEKSAAGRNTLATDRRDRQPSHRRPPIGCQYAPQPGSDCAAGKPRIAVRR